MPNYLPFSPPRHSKYMVFVDGENLAIRYKNVLANAGIEPPRHVKYISKVFALNATYFLISVGFSLSL